MKQHIEDTGKQKLCHELERIQEEINEVALKLSVCQGSDAQQIWSSLANARAHLNNAVEASRRLKSDEAIAPLNL